MRLVCGCEQSFRRWVHDRLQPGGAGLGDARLWSKTIEVATSEAIPASAPDSGAYTTEYAEAAVALLKARGVDTTGQNWRRVDVTLNPGGE